MPALSRRYYIAFLCLAWAAGFAHAQPSPVASRPAVRQSLQEMTRQAGVSVPASISPATGLATFVSIPRSNRLRVPVSPTAPAEERALSFLDSFGTAFGIEDRRSLVVRRSTRDELGYERVRLRQTIRGVPVAGGELSVHLRGNDVVTVHAKTIPDDPVLSVTPLINVEEAATRALAELERGQITDAELVPAELQVLNRGLLEGRTTTSRLAWFVIANAPGRQEYIWLDAETGVVLLRFNQTPSALYREVYYAANTPTLGVLVRSEGGPSAMENDVDKAYDYLGDTHAYFMAEHARDSYDGAGSPLRATVHHCGSPICPEPNARWDPLLEWMLFGSGFASADDVVAHEATHGVTQFSARLFYYMQSGALNESFSDIFGETVDLLNVSGNDSPAVRWRNGEDVTFWGPSRDMMDPTLFDDPGKMTDSQFVCDAPGDDAGGVHSNSGVPNHAYALMVDGGSYNGQTVVGIGLTKAAKVQYRALTQYLLSASDFLDNYYALRVACQDLIGTNGITLFDCSQVDKALEAVEMYFPWPCHEPQASEPPLCQGGGVASGLFFDDFEDPLSTDWDGDVLLGSSHWDTGTGTDLLYSSRFATSGYFHLEGIGGSALADSSVAMTSSVVIPSAARLHFRHSFGFEDLGTTYYDGGVLEYSTTGGATWFDAGSFIELGAFYGGVLYAGSPLAGRQAFAGDSHGYTASQLNLQALAGQSVRFRFRIATDSTVGDYGWFIDDFAIYTCSGAISLQNQLTSPSGFGINSQSDAPIAAEFDDEAAADFNSAVALRIGLVDIPGFYSVGGGPTPRLNLSFHADAAGFPGATQCAYEGLRAGIDFSDTAGNLSARLPGACCLPAGTHWLVAQADMDFGSSGDEWFWRQRTVQSESPFRWRNPGDGFGTGCTDWTDGGSCFVDPDPDLLFALWQVPPPPPGVAINGLTVGSAVLYEAGTLLTAEDFHLVAPADVILRSGVAVALRTGVRVEAGSTLRVQIAPPTGCP